MANLLQVFEGEFATDVLELLAVPHSLFGVATVTSVGGTYDQVSLGDHSFSSIYHTSSENSFQA